MKDKKGFTLIELLAIIVILAIIAVITVPIILNIIDDARSGAAVDSAYGFKDAIEKYYVQEMAKNSNFDLADGSYTINSDGALSQNGEVYNINMSGVKPTGGTITYETGKIKNACLTIDGYKVEYIDGAFTNTGEGECNQELTCQYGKATKKYELIDTPEGHEYCINAMILFGDEMATEICAGKGIETDDGILNIYSPFIINIFSDKGYNLIGNVIREVENGEEKCLTLSDYEIYSDELFGIDISGIGLKGVNVSTNFVDNEYLAYELDLNIPSVLNGVPVTSISMYISNGNIRSVEIPNSVTEIAAGAFMSNQLTSVVIPNSVTKIGGYAFAYNQLTSVVIPNSVTTIDNAAFSDNQLTSVTLGNSVTTIQDTAFAYNQLTSVVIPNSVTEIGEYAFDSNQLTSVTIPNSVISMGHRAFYNNPNLTINVIGYTEKPAGWDSDWNYGDIFYPVNWNYNYQG